MLNTIIGFSIQNKLIIGLLTFALIGIGIMEVTKLPIDAVPDITDNQVQIITVAPSYGATDIERMITFPVEQANSNISGIKEIRSFSRFGLSLVTIVFDDATNVYWARQQVAERLQQIQNQIPAHIGTPEMGPITTGLGEIYQYMVRPQKGYENQYDATELRTIQDWIVRRQLLGVKGVAEVSSFGGKLKQYEILVNPYKLSANNLTIADVFTALEKNNQNTGGAYIEKGNSVLFIRSEGLIGSIADIENVPVAATNAGTPVLLKDVATVAIGYATRFGAMCYNDQGEVAGAVVMMLKGANSSEVIKNVKERIAQIQKTLPEGVVIEPFLDRTKMVNNAIKTVETNLLEGALIVIFILVLFLGNLRAGMLVASVIPLSMLFAVIMMNLFGVSGNLMSLGALDFGLIVDGAVIIVEAVMHQLSHSKHFTHINRLSQPEMDKQVAGAAGKMMNSAVFGQIIILIVYLPIFTLQGIEGKMFQPMAQTVAFALAGAFLLSLTYIPMMSALVLSKKIKHQPNLSDRVMFAIERKYQYALSKILRIPYLVIGLAFGLFGVALYVLLNLGGEFIPALEEGDFAVDTRVLTGSNLTTTIEYTQKTAHILTTRFPEVIKVVTKIGSGEVPTDPMPMEAADMMVILKDKKEWTSAKTFPELAAKMGKALSEVPGVTTGFQFPVQMRFNELMTGARQDVVCKIFGENLDTLVYYAEKLGAIVNTVQGAQDLYVEPLTGLQQVVVSYNRAVMAQHRLSVEEVNRVVNMAFAGQSAGLVFEGEKRFEAVVRLQGELRSNVTDIQNLLIPTPSGAQIPLHQIANVELKNGPNQIQREDAKRRIIVGFNVRNKDVQTVVQELQQKAATQLKLPAGYYTTYGGAFENLNEAKKRLAIAVPVSLALIFLLLFFAFNSVKQGLLIYTAIPLSAIGGIFLLAIRGIPFSISAGVGFIALFGVAVLNGIVLIAEFNRLKKSGMNNLYRIVLMGTKVRLRPVLMTAFVASFGFFPMATSTGAGAEVQRPLATVVIGGLLLATFLTLFVLPVLYVLFEKSGKKRHKHHKHPKSVALSGLLFLFTAPVLLGQTSSFISLPDALNMAVQQNLTLKTNRLAEIHAQTLVNTATHIPPAAIGTEWGQMNSIYFDARFGITQSLNHPNVYRTKRHNLQQEVTTAKAATALSEAELKKMVTELFYQYIALKEKQKLLLYADSLLSEFVAKSALRFAKGEVSVVEKISAQTQADMIKAQLQWLNADLRNSKTEFNQLLNAAANYEPKTDELKTPLSFNPDSLALAVHPALQLLSERVKLAQTAAAHENTMRLPQWNVGYVFQSIRGIGADDVAYNFAPRFQSFQIGIDLPLFTKAYKARVSAANIQTDMAKNQLLAHRQILQTQLSIALSDYNTHKQIVQNFETNQLPNAQLLIKAAQKQLSLGEINFLEWYLLINQAIQTQSNYAEAVYKLNQSAIQINYLTTP